MIQCAFLYSSRDSVPPHMINCFHTVGPTQLLGSEQCGDTALQPVHRAFLLRIYRFSYSSKCIYFYNFLQSNPGILRIVIHHDYPQLNFHIQLITMQATHSMTTCNIVSQSVSLSKLGDNKLLTVETYELQSH
jgi:hypothetical protein